MWTCCPPSLEVGWSGPPSNVDVLGINIDRHSGVVQSENALSPERKSGVSTTLTTFASWTRKCWTRPTSNNVMPHHLVSRSIRRVDAQPLSLAGNSKELALCNMFHMCGLPQCFVPLCRGMRLCRAQASHLFVHHPSENVGPVPTRCEKVSSQRARQEGGGATPSVEAPSLTVLEASHQQSQQMTHSLSEDEAEFAQLGHAVHGAGQAAEPSRNNSASAFNFLTGLPVSVETARLSHRRLAYLTNADSVKRQTCYHGVTIAQRR